MSTKLEFWKYEGLGNDFIVMERAGDDVLPPARVAALCDRHFGIGADGVLLVGAPRSGQSRASMVVLNADGTRPEMCGNGLRCVALHLLERDGSDGQSLIVDTDAGPRACEITRTGAASAEVVSDLGVGRLLEGFRVEVGSRDLAFSRVSMGNPHAICFDHQLSSADIDALAPGVSARFPDGSNVEFAEQRDATTFGLVVWERGVGRTLACGTGAAAMAVAAVSEQRAAFDTALSVQLPGGPLTIWVSRQRQVRVLGPARRVYAGWVDAV